MYETARFPCFGGKGGRGVCHGKEQGKHVVLFETCIQGEFVLITLSLPVCFTPLMELFHTAWNHILYLDKQIFKLYKTTVAKQQQGAYGTLLLGNPL